MVRFRLSRLFSQLGQRYVPGDKFLQATSVELMDANRHAYCHDLIKGVKDMLEKFDSGLILQATHTGIGQAVLEISSPKRYAQIPPANFYLTTETSDFLMATGREAVFTIHKDAQKKSFYYGNSWNPDNHSQNLGLPRYPQDVITIAHHLSQLAYADLYERLQQRKAAAAPTPQAA